MTIDINRYQSISINRLILISDDQSMAKIRVVIDWYRLSIPIDKLIGIDWLQISETGIDTKNTISWQAVIVKIISPTQKCLHVEEDPQARSVGGRAVHGG